MQELHGRLVRLEESPERRTAAIRNQRGTFDVPFSTRDADARPGDVVRIREGHLERLTPNRSAGRGMRWTEHVLDPRRLHALSVRDQVESGVREFFLSEGFQSVRTPLLVPCPGMEVHIRPMRLENSGPYLPTSPEFAMKRLLVGGLERIFQLSPVFRSEPCSTTHHPEFTMLEWYRAYAGYEDIMRDTERLFEFLATRIHGRAVIRFQGREISVRAPWPRLRVRDLFRDLAGVDLVKASTAPLLLEECKRLGVGGDARDTWDDLYFRIWLNVIEPRLPTDQAVFVTRYPASQSALAVKDRDPDGTVWSRRFEVYAGGLELANAFEELTDPVEQRERFVEDMKLRERTYGPEFPATELDEEFLGALEEGLPPSGGIALGVDRLVMLLADEPDIAKTIWLSSQTRSPELPERA